MYGYSGKVLHIYVAVDHLPPEDPVEGLKSEHQFLPSELFSGSLDDIAAVMDREHATRKPN